MTERGAFDLGSAGGPISALYLKLGGAGGGKMMPIEFDKDAFMVVARRHLQDLIGLLNQFRDPATPYPPRPFPKFAKRFNPYDHLARVKEWSLAGEAEDGA